MLVEKIKPIIEEPAFLPSEVPPEDEPHIGRSDGIGLIRAIYDFIVPRDLLAFSLAKKYKGILDLNKWTNKCLYYPLITMCMVVDFLFSALIELVILFIFLSIAISFIRGLGIVDWIITLAVPVT